MLIDLLVVGAQQGQRLQSAQAQTQLVVLEEKLLVDVKKVGGLLLEQKELLEGGQLAEEPDDISLVNDLVDLISLFFLALQKLLLELCIFLNLLVCCRKLSDEGHVALKLIDQWKPDLD